MIKSLGLKRYLAYFIVHALVMCPIFVHADDGTGSGNDDLNFCRKITSNRDIAQWKQPIVKPEVELGSFSPDVDNILKLAKQLPHPDFYNALQLALKKSWRFDANYGFNHCLPENTGYFKDMEPTKVACQTPGPNGEVIIDPITYYAINRQTKTCAQPNDEGSLKALQQNQRDMIVHQLLLGITLGQSIAQTSVNNVFDALTKQHLTPQQLQKLLEENAFYPAVEKALHPQTGPCAPPLVTPPLTPQASGSMGDAQMAAAQIPNETNPAEKTSPFSDQRSLTNLARGTKIIFSNGFDVPANSPSAIVFKGANPYWCAQDSLSLLCTEGFSCEMWISEQTDQEQNFKGPITLTIQKIKAPITDATGYYGSWSSINATTINFTGSWSKDGISSFSCNSALTVGDLKWALSKMGGSLQEPAPIER